MVLLFTPDAGSTPFCHQFLRAFAFTFGECVYQNVVANIVGRNLVRSKLIPQINTSRKTNMEPQNRQNGG